MADKEIHQITVKMDGTVVPHRCPVDPEDIIYWIPERTSKKVRIRFTTTTPVGDRDFNASAAGRHVRKKVSKNASGAHSYTVPPGKTRPSEPEIIIRDRLGKGKKSKAKRAR